MNNQPPIENSLSDLRNPPAPWELNAPGAILEGLPFADEMGAGTERHLTDLMFHETPDAIAGVLADQRALEMSLLTPTSTPLEKLLIRRIALCHLVLHFFDQRMHQSITTFIGGMHAACNEGEQKRVDAAQARYLKAIKALAHIRRLQLPNIQVNLAEQQVNIQS